MKCVANWIYIIYITSNYHDFVYFPTRSGTDCSISTRCCITFTTHSCLSFPDALYGFLGQNAFSSVTPAPGPAKYPAANLVGAIPSLHAFSAWATSPCSFVASCVFPSFHREYNFDTDLGKTLPMPVTHPEPPPIRHGSSQSDDPAYTLNCSWLYSCVNRVTLPALPQVSFVPTILGCCASSDMTSELRSTPLHIAGNCTVSIQDKEG